LESATTPPGKDAITYKEYNNDGSFEELTGYPYIRKPSRYTSQQSL